MNDVNTRRFWWGVVLSWAPWIPPLTGLAIALRRMSHEKSTGLAVVSVGLAESFVFWGVLSIIAAQAAATVFLFRSFERGHPMRSVVSTISICLSGSTVLLVVGVCIQCLRYYARQH